MYMYTQSQTWIYIQYFFFRDPILPAVHTYMNTHIHTHHTCLHMCELVKCSGIWRREQKREGEEDRDMECRWLPWLMTTYICTLHYPPRFHPHCCLRSQSPDFHNGGHPLVIVIVTFHVLMYVIVGVSVNWAIYTQGLQLSVRFCLQIDLELNEFCTICISRGLISQTFSYLILP